MKHKEELISLTKTKQGIYVIMQKPEIGKEYVVKCPVCNNYLDIVPKKMSADSAKCSSCNTVIAFVGVNAPQPASPASSSQGGDEPQDNAKTSSEEKPKEKKATERIAKRKKIKRNGIIQWGVWPFKKSYTLCEGSNVIGREDNADPSDVQLKDSYVSRRSINIEVSESDGGYLFKLTVMNATNTVYVNGHEHNEGTSVYLNDGDTIRLGSTKLRFTLEDKK